MPHTILHDFSSSLFSIGLVFITLKLAYTAAADSVPTTIHFLGLPVTGDVPGKHPGIQFVLVHVRAV